jgi:hypothetical protein
MAGPKHSQQPGDHLKEAAYDRITLSYLLNWMIYKSVIEHTQSLAH